MKHFKNKIVEIEKCSLHLCRYLTIFFTSSVNTLVCELNTLNLLKVIKNALLYLTQSARSKSDKIV